MLAKEDLLEYNTSLFDIYLKFLLIQLRTEIDVPELSTAPPESEEDEEPNEKLTTIEKGLKNAKYCFLLKTAKDSYLISKVHIQGVIIYKDSKENRVIIGLDDGTDITRAILWQKDYAEQFSSDKYFQIGTSINILGKLDYFNGKTQIAIKQFSKVQSVNEEMLFYVQALHDQSKIAKTIDKSEAMEDISPAVIDKEVHEIKRKIMGRIMLDYDKLDLIDKTTGYVVYDNLFTNPNLIGLIQNEIKYAKTPVDTTMFIKDVINSLDQMTFLRRRSGEKGTVYEVEDQIDKNKLFIAKEFKRHKKFTFKDVKLRFRECFNDLFSEEYIFRLLQLLAQQGLLLQDENNTYSFVNSEY